MHGMVLQIQKQCGFIDVEVKEKDRQNEEKEVGSGTDEVMMLIGKYIK